MNRRIIPQEDMINENKEETAGFFFGGSFIFIIFFVFIFFFIFGCGKGIRIFEN